MRGAPTAAICSTCMRRIIPADAGSTLYFLYFFCSFRDHPRGCGEHLCIGWTRTPRGGSSPRMRGARALHRAPANLSGIIPADAGSTSRRQNALEPIEDHPRGCGEHTVSKHWTLSQRGSSPRMRGAPGPHTTSNRSSRIIPADAGSTSWPSRAPPPAGIIPADAGSTQYPCMKRPT